MSSETWAACKEPLKKPSIVQSVGLPFEFGKSVSRPVGFGL